MTHSNRLIAIVRSLLFAAGALLFSHSAAYADLWVDPINGSDASGTGSQLNPFASITKALSVVVVPDTIQLNPGEYSIATGETFPLIVPRGVDIVDPTRAQAAVIRGTKFSATSGEDVIQISNSGHSRALANSFIGFGIWGGNRGIVYAMTGLTVAAEVIIEDLTITGTSLIGLRFNLENASNFKLTCKRVDILPGNNGQGFVVAPTDSVKLRVKSGFMEANFVDCELNGFLTGLVIESRAGAGPAAVQLHMSGVRFARPNMGGLVCVADLGCLIQTQQDHGLYYRCGVSPINPWHGGIVDYGATHGISHVVRHTIFNENFADVQAYQAGRYSLSGNVYHHQAAGSTPVNLPGGIRTDSPGFVQPGVDFHLSSSALARNQTLAALPDFGEGDLNGDFALFQGGACFDGSIDAGPDEYRDFSLYRRGPLEKGAMSNWRLLGPSVGAGPLSLFAVLYFGTAGNLTECPMGPELDLTKPIVFLGSTTLDAVGKGDLALGVPNAPGLVGLPVALQAAFVDPNVWQLVGFSRVVETAVGW